MHFWAARHQTQIKSPDQTTLFSSLLFSPLALLLPIQSCSPLTSEDLQGAELATEGGPGHTGTPGTPAQLGEGRAEERKQTVSSTLGRGGRRWGLELPWETFLDPASLPSSLVDWLISSSSLSSPGLMAFPPFSAPTIHSFPPACIPQRQLLFLGNRTVGSRERAWEPLRASLCTPQLSLRAWEVCCGYPLSTRHHSPCVTTRT